MLNLNDENQKALLFHKNKEYEKANLLFQKLIQQNPKNGSLWGNWALVLEDLHDYNQAEQAFLNGIILEKNAKIRANYAAFLMTHFNGTRHDEAWIHLNIALKLEPQNPVFLNTLGVFYVDQNNFQQAKHYFQQALQFCPNYAPAHLNFAQVFLKEFHFQEAFKIGRFNLKNNPYCNCFRQTPPYPVFPRGIYFKNSDKKSYKNKTLLIIPEQGLGDEIQFARFIPFLKEKLGFSKIHWLCRESLVDLFTCLPNIDIFEGVKNLKININTFWQPHDYWCFLMDLPELLEDSFFNLTLPFPYLKTDSKSTLNEKFFSKTQHKIGLVWRGNSKHSNDLARSIFEIEVFQPLFSLPNTQFIAFQKEINEKEQAFLKRNQIIDLSKELTHFDQTAQYLSQMDWLISIDSSVAHLAGAMKVPCALLLPYFRCDWRWGIHNEKSMWYPCHQLFRQDSPGNWNSVMKKLHAMLKKNL